MSTSAVLVTGASSGIGAEIARLLAKKNHPLVLVARRKESLDRLAEEIRQSSGVKVWVIPQDLSISGSAPDLYAKVKALDIDIGILVNNAGFGIQGRFLDIDLARMHSMIQLNVITLTELTLLFATDMVTKHNGYVLQVSSAAAFLPSAYVSAYAATKHYVKAFSEGICFELRNTGVSVTTLYPGITRTEFNDVAGAVTPTLMRLSVLDAVTVADIGVRAMFARKRSVVPGLINKINAWFSSVLPRGLIVWAAGHILERANGHRSLPPK